MAIIMSSEKHGFAMINKRQTPWMAGNKNAAKSESAKKVPVSFKLDPNIVARLRECKNMAAKIESALSKYWGL